MNNSKLSPVGPVLAAIKSGKIPKSDFCRQRVAARREGGDSRFSNRRHSRSVKRVLMALKRVPNPNQTGTGNPVSKKEVLA
jgi:hypothetical protein